jgi:hypothetical protein
MRFLYHRHIAFSALFFFVLASGQTKAQGIEFGLFLGASNYMGDLSNDGVVLSTTAPSGSIIARYNLSEKWALKGFFGYGRVSGTDQNSSYSVQKSRNLSFYTDIYEASLQLEFNLVRNSYRYTATKKMIPYLFAGIGLFNFNPKTELNGTKVELQPLGTEGQGTTTYNDRVKYALTQACIPLGIGFKKRISKRLTIGMEFGARYTFTNYLDDVGGVYADANVVGRSNGETARLLSDRSWELTPDGKNLFDDGDARSMKKININDIYFMGGITFTYIFPNAGIRCPRF